MRILAVEPYYGGSHRAFLDGWIARSRHDWTVVGLSARHWRWRMRHAALTAAEQVQRPRADERPSWDLVFCSDMLNLPEFLGLRPDLAGLPTLAYFHENQLTYPDACRDRHDYHHAYTNILTAVAANATWFNSDYHRREFFAGAKDFLHRMPDHAELTALNRAQECSRVFYPGIEWSPDKKGGASSGSLHFLWAARWEADKRLDRFLEVVLELAARDLPFEVSVIGGEASDGEAARLDSIRSQLGDRVRYWGFVPEGQYREVLRTADVVVSTADHEFFGISVLEAVAAGAWPLLPRRLAYPEVFGPVADLDIFYDDTPEALLSKLCRWIEQCRVGGFPSPEARPRLDDMVAAYSWGQLAPEYDAECEQMVLRGKR